MVEVCCFAGGRGRRGEARDVQRGKEKTSVLLAMVRIRSPSCSSKWRLVNRRLRTRDTKQGL